MSITRNIDLADILYSEGGVMQNEFKKNFIGYFNVNQEHQYLVVYPDNQRALSQMLVHSYNGETTTPTRITTFPITFANAPTTTTNIKTQWFMIDNGNKQNSGIFS